MGVGPAIFFARRSSARLQSRNRKRIRLSRWKARKSCSRSRTARTRPRLIGGDNSFVYFEVDSGISRIRATGGRAETVYKFPPADHVIGAEWPIVLPGSKGLLFRRRREGQNAADYEILAMPLPKGEAHVLLRGIDARYAEDGHLRRRDG